MPSKIKPRKQRTIKNSIVNIDDVVIDGGIAFANWIPIVKQKLKERELQLLQRRREISNNIIISRVNTFVAENSTNCISIDQLQIDAMTIYKQQIQHQITNSNSEVMSRYIEGIDNALSKWNGYKPKTKVVNNFREYYQGCRRWFDLKKINIFAIAFWIPIIKVIHEFTKISAAHTFCNEPFNLEKAYSNYFSLYISKGLFEAQMQPDNTRLVFLIPASIYETLIKQCNPKSEIKGKNKEIRTRYLLSIYRKISRCQRSFETELEVFHHQKHNNYTHRNDWANRDIGASKTARQTHTGNTGNELNKDWTFKLNEPCDMMFRSPSPQYIPYCASPMPIMTFKPSSYFEHLQQEFDSSLHIPNSLKNTLSTNNI